jgi:hypothetical protein
MEKHPYDELIETVADKMKEHKDDNLGFGIFEKVEKDLGLSRGTAWDASGWMDRLLRFRIWGCLISLVCSIQSVFEN